MRKVARRSTAEMRFGVSAIMLSTSIRMRFCEMTVWDECCIIVPDIYWQLRPCIVMS
jgi:hypothetical protein